MPINFQWLPFKSIIGPIDHANISAGVVNGAANAVSFSVLERFSGSTIRRRMKPIAKTPVE
jgi:hypothetical protein